LGQKLMARKNLLAGLTDTKLTAVNNDTAGLRNPPSLSYSRQGALGAVTRSIDDLAAKAEGAKALEAKLTAGQVIIELDPSLVDCSFITDRMEDGGESTAELRRAIESRGQESPILVRPHPSTPGRYQVAFGHRRLRVAADLHKPVRAVVKILTDRDLVLAQGQENSARANLSFIERANFAHQLENAGYDRETIMSALAVDKTSVSRMISVVTRIPAETVQAIGPAPATGRDRWVELAARFEPNKHLGGLSALLGSHVFKEAASDDRFNLVAEELTNRRLPMLRQSTGRKDIKSWSGPDGRRVVDLTYKARSCQLTIDQRSAPGFGDYLLTQMERLFADYRAAHHQTDSDAAASPPGKNR
jgi:ParB family chromosome partitioning protein